MRRSAAAARTDVEVDKHTYFLCVADPIEQRLAQKYVAEKYPGAKVVQEIKLMKLSERHNVIALVREDDQPTIRESEPIRCADHIETRLDGEDEMDSVCARTFLHELAQAALPATLVRRSDLPGDVVKLGHC